MKKSLLFIMSLFVILITGSQTFAQEAAEGKDYKFTIKTNPLNALGGPIYVLWVVPLTAEYKLNFEARTFENQSVQVSGAFLGSSPLLSTIHDMSSDTSAISRGFRAQLWYKFFLTQDKAPNGFYVGPHISYAYAKIMNSEVHSSYVGASKLQFHVALGYQVITKGGFALDIFTGIGVKNKSFDMSVMSTDNFFDEFELSNRFTVSIPFGLSFGYAF